jgi:hypothetical protein
VRAVVRAVTTLHGCPASVVLDTVRQHTPPHSPVFIILTLLPNHTSSPVVHPRAFPSSPRLCCETFLVNVYDRCIVQVQLLRRGGGKLDVVTYSHLLNHVGKQEGVHAAKVRCPETHIHIHTFKHTFKHTLHTLSQTRSMYEIAVPSSLLTRSRVSVHHHADCPALVSLCGGAVRRCWVGCVRTGCVPTT